MQGNPNVDTHFNTVRNPSQDAVTFEKTQAQTVSEEDFIELTKNQEAQLANIQNKIDEHKEQLENILEEKDYEIGVLHKIIEGEDFEGDVDLEEDVIDPDSLQQYQQVKQLNQKIEQLENQYSDAERQTSGWRDVAQDIVEERDDLTLEEEIETGEE